MRRPILAMLALLVVALPIDAAPPTDAELEAARVWLRAHPPTSAGSPERDQRLAVLQAACDALGPSEYVAYVQAWHNDPTSADRAERTGVLRYLRAAWREAIADIVRTRVRRGAVVWYLYNMGVVVRTPDSCFGIDLHLRDAVALVPVLDFLLISHEHGDHNTVGLAPAMRAAGKPVVARSLPASHRPEGPTELRFGRVRVKVDIGDHHVRQPGQEDNMLMFQVECGPASGNFVLYHSGDGSNHAKMKPNRPIDLFVPHIRVGMSIPAAVAHVRPKFTLLSHVLELAHSPKPPNAWRWSVADARASLPGVAPDRALVLTWGERWQAPGTTTSP